MKAPKNPWAWLWALFAATKAWNTRACRKISLQVSQAEKFAKNLQFLHFYGLKKPIKMEIRYQKNYSSCANYFRSILDIVLLRLLLYCEGDIRAQKDSFFTLSFLFYIFVKPHTMKMGESTARALKHWVPKGNLQCFRLRVSWSASSLIQRI